jgi:DNA-binding Lrp family transcriptional regulator
MNSFDRKILAIVDEAGTRAPSVYVTFGEIAKTLKISRQTVMAAHKSGIEKMRKMWKRIEK